MLAPKKRKTRDVIICGLLALDRIVSIEVRLATASNLASESGPTPRKNCQKNPDTARKKMGNGRKEIKTRSDNRSTAVK